MLYTFILVNQPLLNEINIIFNWIFSMKSNPMPTIFKPVRLYIKELNGLKYFGKSIAKNIEEYYGSGKRWTNHIRKYGKANIRTIWVSDWFVDQSLLVKFATEFSIRNLIVESNEWANLCIETGLNGGPRDNSYFKKFNKLPKTDEIKRKIGAACKITSSGKTKSQETKNKISNTLRQSMKGLVFWNNGIINKRSRICPGLNWTRGKLFNL